MQRIRTVKPDFFKHYDLFLAEKETGLPLRVSFAGLWTCADREGRFKWQPQRLKVDILPYDDVHFSRVLDALATRGFIVRYVRGNAEFGWIPSWSEHQVINNKEGVSTIPAYNEQDAKIKEELTRAAREHNALSTREPRDDDACPKERKGKEGKGKEGDIEPRPASPHNAIIAHFKKRFEAYAGSPWHVDGGKVGSLVKNLLVTYKTDNRVCELIDKFFDMPTEDFLDKAGRDFGVFYSQVNKLAADPVAKAAVSDDADIAARVRRIHEGKQHGNS